MKRRDLFKMFATLAVSAVAAPLAAVCKPEGFTEYAEIHALRITNTPLTANDDIFGPDHTFIRRAEQYLAVREGMEDYRNDVYKGALSTLTSERGVPEGLEEKDMRYWAPYYRPNHSVRSGGIR